jgi:hypothetical protein
VNVEFEMEEKKAMARYYIAIGAGSMLVFALFGFAGLIGIGIFIGLGAIYGKIVGESKSDEFIMESFTNADERLRREKGESKDRIE